MTTKQQLLDKIREKEAQLSRAQQESDAWNKGKYKKSSSASISKIFVESLRKEISKLYSQLNELDG